MSIAKLIGGRVARASPRGIIASGTSAAHFAGQLPFVRGPLKAELGRTATVSDRVRRGLGAGARKLGISPGYVTLANRYGGAAIRQVLKADPRIAEKIKDVKKAVVTKIRSKLPKPAIVTGKVQPTPKKPSTPTPTPRAPLGSVPISYAAGKYDDDPVTIRIVGKGNTPEYLFQDTVYFINSCSFALNSSSLY